MMYQSTNQDVDYLEYPNQYFSSPSTRIEETDIEHMGGALLSKWSRELSEKPFYHSFINLIEIDLSSIHPHFEIKTETSHDLTTISEEDIAMEMLEHDFVVKMPPKKKYKIHAVVRKIQKGKPRVVEPDEFLF